jgi:anaerobic selenocysteine-containing dehydrogenase
MERKLTRRSFFKIAGAGTAGLAAWATGTMALRPVAADERTVLLQNEQKLAYTACTMCPAECGLAVNVENGIVSAIYGNEHVPYNAGTVCAKGSSGIQMTYSPYRLQNPLMRVGERGEGKFKQVSWDEALSFIAKKLVDIKRQYGPETVIMDTGDVTDGDAYYRLFYAYGTPHCTQHGAICDTPRRLGPALVDGGWRIEPDLMRPALVRQTDGSLKNDYSYSSKLIIYVGWNPFTATRINYESRGTVAARINGAKIVVVDPALSNTAAKADKWLPIRPGTDADLFAAMLRYILENDDPNNPYRRYIDWSVKDTVDGWDEFMGAFRDWWDKKDPVNGLPYFSVDWAAQRTGLAAGDIAWLADEFGRTKPAALVWGMNGIGHHYNGGIASILGIVLDVITGNFETPGGVIDMGLVRSSKVGSANGSSWLARKVTRTVGGTQVTATQNDLHMDHMGDWPSAWWDALGDYPRRFMEGVTLRYGPFRGHQYPIKAYIFRTGNVVITGSATWSWQDALTAKDAQGNYKVELLVGIDTPYLETGMYADVLLPEAGYLERMSLSDIYPSHPVLYLRDRVIAPLHQSKTPYEIMIGLAKALAAAGDADIQAQDFWEKYPTEESFVDDCLKPAPGMLNVGTPLPYPRYPEGYKILGTPDSLEAGRVTVDDKTKTVQGEPLTVKWLRDNHGVAIWPMAWGRHKAAGGGVLATSTKKFEFHFHRLEQYNKLIDQAGGEVPATLQASGLQRYPTTFYWYETVWNPYTNPDYAKYRDEFPFQVISGRVHHAMTATQMVDWLGRISEEDTWLPLNDDRVYHPQVMGPAGPIPSGTEHRLPSGAWSVAVIQMNRRDGERLGLKTGDLVELTNPLGKSTRGKVYLGESVRPGVLRMPFGGGGRFSPGVGQTFEFRDSTPNANMLVDPHFHEPIMGMSVYQDMVVKVKKV